MSESTREKAGQVKDQLYWARWHLDNAKRIVESVPDPGLRRKIDEASKKAGEAHEHAKRGLEQK